MLKKSLHNPQKQSPFYALLLIFILADIFAIFEIIFSGAFKDILSFILKCLKNVDLFILGDFLQSRTTRLNLLLFNTFAWGVLLILAPFLVCRRTRKWLLENSKIICIGAFLLIFFSSTMYLAHIFTISVMKIEVFAFGAVMFFILLWLISLAFIHKYTPFELWDYRIIFFSSLGVFRSLVLTRTFILLFHSLTLKSIFLFFLTGIISQIIAVFVGLFFSWFSLRSKWGVRLGKSLAMIIFAISLWNLSLPPREWLKVFFRDISSAGLLGFTSQESKEKQKAILIKNAPNVILIVLDTVRADHLSLYGYKRKTTPFLDWLGMRSVVFERAYSASNWTIPSHASIFTGLLPAEHNCTYENLRLYSKLTTLAEKLRSLGYITLGYSNNQLINHTAGLTQGFDRFLNGGTSYGIFSGEIIHWLSLLTLHPEVLSDSGARLTNRVLTKWFWRLSEQKRPFFLFVNYMEAHIPYPNTLEAYRFFPEPRKAKKQYANFQWDWSRYICKNQIDPEFQRFVINRYDGAIYYLDQMLAQLWKKMKRFKLLNNTILIIVGDHGELFGEHNFWGHDFYLWEPLIHIPLIIFYPRLLTPKRVKNPVSLMEVPEMIMELINGRVPRQISHPASEPILSEVYYPWGLIDTIKNYCLPEQLNRFRRRQKAVIEWPYKLIWDSRGKDLLFNIEKDPQEKIDLKNEKIRTYAELSSFINLYRARTEILERKTPAIDIVTRNALKALGYVK